MFFFRTISLALLAATVGPALLPASSRAAEREPKDKPYNVLFIPVDDLNDWIHCLGGNPQCRTPNLDRLAARGVLFNNAHCAAPACNPSRAALLTGVRPWTSGVYVNPQPWREAMPDVVTLPQHFMAHGYHVVGGGKVFHGAYDDDASWHDYNKKQGDPKPTPAVQKDPHSKSGGIIWGTLEVDDADMDDYRVTSWAIDYLKKPHERPFFLACGLFKPHMPWQVPQKYYDMYPLESIVLPKTIENDLADVPAPGVKMAKPQGDHATMLETGNWKYAVQAYLATITFADTQVGRLLDALDASDYADNTIIVLWGDHGWHLGEKQHWRKFALWEEATKAPLMFVVPGLTRPGTVCETPVDFMNIAPTLADLCGLPEAAHYEGVSMRELLADPETTWERPAITTHGYKNHAVRSAKYRYIRYEDGSEELYDHDTDPMEWTNVAGKPQYADVIAEHASWLPKENADPSPYDPRKRPNKK